MVQDGSLRRDFPAWVVEGMLASIGLLIIAKQLPLIFGSPGNKFEAHEFWGIVREAPSRFMEMDPKVFFLGDFLAGADLRVGVARDRLAPSLLRRSPAAGYRQGRDQARPLDVRQRVRICKLGGGVATARSSPVAFSDDACIPYCF